MKGVKNVVLVHGAWADGSSWSKPLPLLQAAGLHAAAVQNPLNSIADDVASTNRLINAQDGPVLLVGHSYGGAVITETGNNPKSGGTGLRCGLRSRGRRNPRRHGGEIPDPSSLQ